MQEEAALQVWALIVKLLLQSAKLFSFPVQETPEIQKVPAFYGHATLDL